MAGGNPYLLDTNVVLHATREGSPVARAIDAQFELSSSRFRPAICEVSIGELLAFSRSNKWGEKRVERLNQEIGRCLSIEISTPGVHDRWAEMHSRLKAGGRTIGQNDIWIAATASIAGLTLLTTDGDFEALRGLGFLNVVRLDARTGVRL